MFRSVVVLQFTGPSNSQFERSGAAVVSGVDPDVYGQGSTAEAPVVVPCVSIAYVFPSRQVQNVPP